MMLVPEVLVQRKIMAGSFMIKKAYSVQMTYDVTDTEKLQAERALLCFNYANKILGNAADHLDIMKTPFKDNPDISPKDVMSARAAIRRFRDKAIENFNQFKLSSFKCINIMQSFSSDTQTLKLMKSFISSVESLENKVNDFADLFADLESKDYSKSVVSSIEDIQKQCKEVEEIINERIKTHIQSNILAKSWVDAVSDELQMNVQKKTPLIMDLFNKRQDQLNEMVQERSQLGD
jgi:hypothetical protein